jgi:hypothetical protein
MPLNYGKSKQAFSENVAAERRAGKPEKQAVAIAYSVKRRGKPRRKERTTPREVTSPRETKPNIKLSAPKTGTAKSMAGKFRKFINE